jgi:hypothetical protein
MTNSARPPEVLAEIRNGQAVVHCPFCGKKHFHGALAGHRLSHCEQGALNHPGYIIVLPTEETQHGTL